MSTLMQSAPRLAVRPDYNPRMRHPRGYAIVSPLPLHRRHNLVGYQRGFGENHAGQWVYRFYSWRTAARVAHEVATSKHCIWEGQES